MKQRWWVRARSRRWRENRKRLRNRERWSVRLGHCLAIFPQRNWEIVPATISTSPYPLDQHQENNTHSSLQSPATKILNNYPIPYTFNIIFYSKGKKIILVKSSESNQSVNRIFFIYCYVIVEKLLCSKRKKKICMVAIFLLISNSPSLFSCFMGTIPSAPTTMDITVAFIVHNFFSSLAKSRYLSNFFYLHKVVC